MAGDAIYANGDIHPAASTVGEVVQVAETQDAAASMVDVVVRVAQMQDAAASMVDEVVRGAEVQDVAASIAEDVAALGDIDPAASAVGEVVQVAETQDAAASLAEDAARVGDSDSATSMAEDVSAGDHSGLLNEQEFEGSLGEGDTVVGTVCARLVGGFTEYFIHLLVNVREMEIFRIYGPPAFFDIHCVHSAEVEAANTLVMMAHADPVLGFAVPRRSRSKIPRRRPRIPSSTELAALGFTMGSTMPERHPPRNPSARSGGRGNGGGQGQGRGRGRVGVAGRRGGRH